MPPEPVFIEASSQGFVYYYNEQGSQVRAYLGESLEVPQGKALYCHFKIQNQGDGGKCAVWVENRDTGDWLGSTGDVTLANLDNWVGRVKLSLEKGSYTLRLHSTYKTDTTPTMHDWMGDFGVTVKGAPDPDPTFIKAPDGTAGNTLYYFSNGTKKRIETNETLKAPPDKTVYVDFRIQNMGDKAPCSVWAYDKITGSYVKSSGDKSMALNDTWNGEFKLGKTPGDGWDIELHACYKTDTTPTVNQKLGVFYVKQGEAPPEEFSFRYKIDDPEGAPVQGATVSIDLYESDAMDNEIKSTNKTTDSSGYTGWFIFEDEWFAKVKVTKSGYDSRETSINLDSGWDGETIGLTIAKTLERYDITITVTNPEGNPLQGAEVTRKVNGNWTDKKVTGSNGQVVYTNMPYGGYDFKIYHENWGVGYLHLGSGVESQTFQFEEKVEAELFFTVKNGDTGNPIQGADVRVSSEETGYSETKVTDSEGKANFTLEPDHTYDYRVTYSTTEWEAEPYTGSWDAKPGLRRTIDVNMYPPGAPGWLKMLSSLLGVSLEKAKSYALAIGGIFVLLLVVSLLK